jgi:alpha-methylacyl-CoA racemase
MGPFDGVRVVEVAAIGPAPYAAMMLADMGAEVLRVDRPIATQKGDPSRAVLNRGRRSVVLDLKTSAGADTLLRLANRADVLIEGFRPGVMERLGVGPDVCLNRNPRLVYGRMTGFGRGGPLSPTAGHDINYLALSGALQVLSRRGERPVAPPGLVADFGGGGLMLAFGIAAALLERTRSGQGQVVDAAMVDGVASLTAMVHGFLAQGRQLDDAPYYDTYETSDGGFLAVAAVEPQFYAEFLRLLGLDEVPDRDDPTQWDALRKVIDGVLRTRTRDEWAATFEGTDACVTPVLSLTEATTHRHNAARHTFCEEYGVVQPSPAPRFSRSPGRIASPPPRPGEHSRAALLDWGLREMEIDDLLGETP